MLVSNIFGKTYMDYGNATGFSAPPMSRSDILSEIAPPSSINEAKIRIVNEVMVFDGDYMENEAHLFAAVANFFHCAVVASSSPGKSKCIKINVFGNRENIESVFAMYQIALSKMMHQMSLINEKDIPWISSTKYFKRSFLIGFVDGINSQLNKATYNIIENSGRHNIEHFSEKEKAVNEAKSFIKSFKIKTYNFSLDKKNSKGYELGLKSAVNLSEVCPIVTFFIDICY